jgi:hypothetical protein
LVAQGNYPSVANYRAKIPAIFRGIFGIFVIFGQFNVFIPQFPAEPYISAEPWLGNTGLPTGVLVE